MARALTLPSEAKRRRQVSFYKKIILAGICLLIILGAVIYGLRRDAVRIGKINIQGQGSIDKTEIEKSVRQSLLGYYLFLIPKNSVFFYPKRKIENSLLSGYKSLSKAEISAQNLRSISVQLFERAPHYVWCADSSVSESEPVCYFLDNDGLIFAKSPEFSGNVYIKFYGTLLGNGASVIGNRFLEEGVFKELDTFINAIKDKIFGLSWLTKHDDGDFELYLEKGGKIVFSLKDGASKPLSNLFSAMQTDPLKSALINRPRDLEYIDLRFGNKVFFKFR